jgi:hypothetical protein
MGEGVLKIILDFVRGRGAVSRDDVAAGCGLAPDDAGDGLALLAWRGVLRPEGGGRFAEARARRLPGRSYVSAITHPDAARLMAAR